MEQLPAIITKARARLLVRAPFIGSIALGLRMGERARYRHHGDGRSQHLVQSGLVRGARRRENHGRDRP